MSTDTDFVGVLRQLRRAHGWTQLDLTRRIADAGVPAYSSFLSKVESGNHVVTLSFAVAVADAFGTSLDAMLGRTCGELVVDGFAERVRGLLEAHDLEVDLLRAEVTS